MEILHRLQHLQQRTIRSIDLSPGRLNNAWQNRLIFLQKIRSIGADSTLDEYEQRKLRIFNLLNFFQLVTGVLLPVIGFLSSSSLPASAWMVAALPALVSIAALWLNSLYKYELALLIYFIFYPVLTCIIYMNGMNPGAELFFVLYGILAVFFFQDIGYLLFAAALTMISYFVLSVAFKNYQ